MSSGRAERGADWQKAVMWIGGALILISALYIETASRAVELWSSSSAYNYAFLIVPISAYLVWEDRARVLSETPAPSILGLAVLVFFSVTWLVADAIGINEGRQLSLVGMYQGTLLTLLGVRIFRILLFPITYLWLLVPTGEFLVPTLQQITTDGSVWLLELSQIPTYYEGFLIQVPAGNFLVEPGCSGLNFILSSFALSLLYGKLTYRRWRTRLICIAIALVASVLSNILRVYLIIALTQVSDRRLNIADDHLVYGWGFFAVIMLLMMWFGLKFEDRGPTSSEGPVESASPSTSFVRLPAAACIAVICAGIPLGLQAALTSEQGDVDLTLTAPQRAGDWTATLVPQDWKPVVVEGVPGVLSAYTREQNSVDVFVAYFPFQTQTFEPQAFRNRAADPTQWTNLRTEQWVASGPDGKIPTRYQVWRRGNVDRHTVLIGLSGECITISRLMSRVCAAPGRYGLGEPSGALVVLSVRAEDGTQAKETIQAFLSDLDIRQFVQSHVPLTQRQTEPLNR